MSDLTRRQVLLAGSAAPLLAAGKKPNIVFLYSDDHHWQCLGANGNPHIHTPNLDRLASRGVNFTNGLISTPQCCPSRGVMLSGLETYQSGLRSNGATSFRESLGPTVVEQMRRGGYETILCGKWHIQPTPEQCGFSKAPLWLRGGGSVYRDPRLRRGHAGVDEPIPGHITDLLTDAAIDSVRVARQPFLLWLAYNAPHTPWYADEKYRQHYEGKDPAKIAAPSHPPGGKPFDWITYYSVITHLDEAAGRVINAVEQAGLWDHTLFLFVGDNGYTCGTRGWNGKVHSWEESIRVPFVAAGGMVKRGVKCETPVASVDLPATWLDLAGIQPAYTLAGRSLRRALDKGKPEFDASFVTWDDGRPEGLAVGVSVEPYRLVRTSRHKFVKWESGKEALFDVEADPAEQNNLAASEPKRATQLREKLRARMKATSDHAASW